MSSSENFTGPPALAVDGEGYEDWKKLIKMWAKFTKYEKNNELRLLLLSH